MPKRLTNKEFIDRCQEAHGNKWDYKETLYKNKRSKIKFTCKKHGIVEQLPMNHLRIGCPYCSTGNHNTYSFVKECKWSHDYSKTEYVNNKTKITFTCAEHGDIEQLPDDHLKIGCPMCAGRRDVSKYTPEVFLAKARDIHGDKYSYPNLSFQNVHDKITIHCPKHGDFKQKICAHINLRQGCKECGYENRLMPQRRNNQQFKLEAKLIHGDLYDYSLVNYKGRKNHVLIKCPIHGVFEQMPYLHLQGNICPFCAGRGISKYNKEYFIQRSREVHGDLYDYSQVSIDKVTDKVTILCPKHGAFSQQAAAHINSGCGCPICSSNESSSKAEQEIRDYIKGCDSFYIENNNRTALKGLEIDIFVPKIGVGIEYHGLYWHCESRVDKKYHFKKANVAESEGIILLQIFEHEWSKHPDIIKSMIRSKLQISSRKFSARKTDVVSCNLTTSKQFLNNYHIQGNSAASVKLGLEYRGELIACMTFGQSRFDRSYQWELIRYCCKKDCSVIGGASKLLSHFRRKHSGSIVSFADRRFSNGNVYRQLGFIDDGTTDPSYFYYNFSTKDIKGRMQCQKHKLKNFPHYTKDKSEREIMQLNGYDRIWDAGHKRFILF